MRILPFKKHDKLNENIVLINELREIRTNKKQLSIREKEIIALFDENKAADDYLYDVDNNKIAKLTIYHSISFDSKKFKEDYPALYDDFPKQKTIRRWGIL